MKQTMFNFLVAGLCLSQALLFTGCSSSGSGDNLLTDLTPQTSTYSNAGDSTAFLDSRLRESAPSQVQGTMGQVKCGDENGLSLDYIAMDSSVTFLDSIPPGHTIVACTLFVKIGALPDNDNDSVALDLWSVPQSWNENEVSWNSRNASSDWIVPGGGGTLIEAGLISAKRVSLFSLEWRIRGIVFDTITISEATAVPIPIDSTLARMNYNRLSYGLALRRNPATSTNALVSFTAVNNLQPGNRPYMVWVYR